MYPSCSPENQASACQVNQHPAIIKTPPTGLVTHWTFDSQTGRVVADVAPSGIDDDDATLNGATIVTSVGLDGAVYFNGNGDSVAVANSDDINRGVVHACLPQQAHIQD